MLIYDVNNVTIDINLEIVPCILTFNIYGIEYRYLLDATNLDNCPYDKQIKDWFEDNNPTLTEIIWEWNINKSEFSKIEYPLKV